MLHVSSDPIESFVFILLKVQSVTDGDVTEASLSGGAPRCIFGLPYAVASLRYGSLGFVFCLIVK